LSQIEDGPHSEQFELVGYTSVLVINNVGSVLVYLLFLPVVLAFSNCFQKSVKRLLGKRADRVSRLVLDYFNRQF